MASASSFVLFNLISYYFNCNDIYCNVKVLSQNNIIQCRTQKKQHKRTIKEITYS